jgi:hypothetical protein
MSDTIKRIHAMLEQAMHKAEAEWRSARTALDRAEAVHESAKAAFYYSKNIIRAAEENEFVEDENGYFLWRKARDRYIEAHPNVLAEEKDE